MPPEGCEGVRPLAPKTLHLHSITSFLSNPLPASSFSVHRIAYSDSFRKMQLHKLAIFTTLLAAAHVYAYNAYQSQYCYNQAYGYCQGNTDLVGKATPYWVKFYRCMAGYWRSHSPSKTCDYPKLGCNCYNGCIADSTDSGVIDDPASYCRNGCDMANQPLEWCRW